MGSGYFTSCSGDRERSGCCQQHLRQHRISIISIGTECVTSAEPRHTSFVQDGSATQRLLCPSAVRCVAASFVLPGVCFAAEGLFWTFSSLQVGRLKHVFGCEACLQLHRGTQRQGTAARVPSLCRPTDSERQMAKAATGLHLERCMQSVRLDCAVQGVPGRCWQQLSARGGSLGTCCPVKDGSFAPAFPPAAKQIALW